MMPKDKVALLSETEFGIGPDSCGYIAVWNVM